MLATLETPQELQLAPAVRPVAVRPLVGARPQREKVSCTVVATLVLWVGCAAVGVGGVMLPYARPLASRPEPAPVTFEKIEVQLTRDLVMPAATPTFSDPLAPPPAAEVMSPAPVPAAIPVAVPSSAIAFALPVDGAVRVVDFSQAAHGGRASSETVSRASGPRAETLVFGQGEGRQPAPAYPPRASRLGQEGVVSVRFTVNESGQVISSEVAEPCVWPLLNEAAMRTVRERWRFRAGPIRVYEVAIRFRLRK